MSESIKYGRQKQFMRCTARRSFNPSQPRVPQTGRLAVPQMGLVRPSPNGIITLLHHVTWVQGAAAMCEL